ncbi:MAG: outer membrane protein assembly factor BamC [Gammaproteobacteria bacterium]
MKTIVILILSISIISGCSTFNSIFPDRTKEYQQAEVLPDLEIPPDLTVGAISNSMSIPGEMNRTGRTSQVNSTATINQAVIESVNNNKPLLAIPEEFTRAWAEVDQILQNAAVTITSKDQSTGTFEVNYSADAPQEDAGFFSRMAFWNRGSSSDYKLSLTGVGNKTELVILDSNGEWNSTQETQILLTTIRDHYNLNRTQ